MHVIEADLAEGALDAHRAVEDRVLGVEQHEHAVERGRPWLHGGIAAAEPPRVAITPSPVRVR